MRAWLIVIAVSTGARAEPVRWQQATSAPSIQQVWGIESELHGVGPAGVHRSTDGGSTWTLVDAGAANGIWGTDVDDLWIVRDRTLHHSVGGSWTTHRLPVPFATKLDGMWGAGSDLYVFGTDRSSQTGVLVHSRDRGQTWTPEPIARVASVWGRSANEVFAVGGREVMRSTGDGSWAPIRSGSETLHAIGGTANTIYAVGDNGTILAFDGKTWTRRTSAVTYALSSITVTTGELYVGSSDGPPLRSTDGVVWKPITALVPKGHVWASASTVIAVAGDVHVLGGPPAPVVVAPNPVGLPSRPSLSLGHVSQRRHALDLRLRFDGDDALPYRRDVLRIVASRFGDGYPVLPRLASAGTRPTFRFDEIKDCGAYVPPPWSATAIMPVRIACTSSCGSVQVTARVQPGPVSNYTYTVGAAPIAACADQPLAIKAIVERLERERGDAYLAKLHAAATLTTPGTDARAEALSRYLLEGGDDPSARRALAAEFGVAETWSGLFWNRAPSVAATSARCDFEQMFLRDAIESAANKRFGDALSSYEAIIVCNKSYSEQAAIAACNAHATLKAKLHYSELPADKQPAIVKACLENGLDPRVR